MIAPSNTGEYMTFFIIHERYERFKQDLGEG